MTDKMPLDKDSEGIVDERVSAIYQGQEQKVPSQQVDERILALASEKTKIELTPSTWRKWQWPTSVAASVMFITLIVYTQYDQFDPSLEQMPPAPVDTFDIADRATVDEAQQAQKAKLETRDLNSQKVSQRLVSAPLPDQNEFNEDLIDEPERARYAEKEALTLASRAMENVEIDSFPLEIEISPELDVAQQIPTNIVLSREEEQQQAMQENQRKALMLARQKAEQTAKKEHLRQEAMSLSSARLMSQDYPNENNSVAKTQVDTEYLDKLLDQLNEQSKLTSPVVAENQTIVQLQRDIFDYLLLLKIANPSIQIDQKYLRVLTEKQRAKLKQ